MLVAELVNKSGLVVQSALVEEDQCARIVDRKGIHYSAVGIKASLMLENEYHLAGGLYRWDTTGSKSIWGRSLDGKNIIPGGSCIFTGESILLKPKTGTLVTVHSLSVGGYWDPNYYNALGPVDQGQVVRFTGRSKE